MKRSWNTGTQKNSTLKCTLGYRILDVREDYLHQNRLYMLSPTMCWCNVIMAEVDVEWRPSPVERIFTKRACPGLRFGHASQHRHFISRPKHTKPDSIQHTTQIISPHAPHDAVYPLQHAVPKAFPA